MDKFRVGQKVKVIAHLDGPPEDNNIGRVGFITASRYAYLWHEGNYNLYYDMDDDLFVLEEEITPVSDGDEKSSWTESLWKPNEVKA